MTNGIIIKRVLCLVHRPARASGVVVVRSEVSRAFSSNIISAASSSNGGYLASLASSPVVHAAETLFLNIHTHLHLPWWSVIVISTFSLRALATLPLAVHQAKLVSRIELLLPNVKELQEAVKHRVITECKREGLSVEEANKRMMKEVCHVLLFCLNNCEQPPLLFLLTHYCC